MGLTSFEATLVEPPRALSHGVRLIVEETTMRRRKNGRQVKAGSLEHDLLVAGEQAGRAKHLTVGTTLVIVGDARAVRRADGEGYYSQVQVRFIGRSLRDARRAPSAVDGAGSPFEVTED